MKVVFGIDVSSDKSNVCVLVDNSKSEFTISNDRPGFFELLNSLKTFTNPQIIFEATGVYSRRLQTFLQDYGYDYVIMNPLTAKKEMDIGLRHNKTDKNDAYHLALIQKLYNHAVNKPQSEQYQQLNALSRFYAQLTDDVVASKNRLHKALQSTFPEVEKLFESSKGENYWMVLSRYPHCEDVLQSNPSHIIDELLKVKGYGQKRAEKTTKKLFELAKKSYPSVPSNSIESSQVTYYAHRLIALEEHRKQLVSQMAKLAKELPNHDLEILKSIPGFGETTAIRVLAELGDVRRFSNPNKINAFIGIDPGHYQSGEKDSSLSITKHGNAEARKILYRAIGQIDNASKFKPCHIADYYESKKRSSQTKGFKKIAIASVHKLIRTIYALITKDQLYDYSVATHNQKDFCRN